MGDYKKLHNFNPKANFSMVRFGGNTPITEMELNEAQAITSNQVKEVIQSVVGDKFLGGGKLSLNTDTNEFSIVNQHLINQGRQLYVSQLKTILANNETVYLDIFTKDIDKDSEIKEYGNQQETHTIENTLLDPRLEGIETARRQQVCFDLAKETSRFEFETTSPVINIGETPQNQSRVGYNSKILKLEGNTYQNPEDPSDLHFVGIPFEDNYIIPITSSNTNLFDLDREYSGCNYNIEDETLEVIPTVPNSWNGLSCKVNVIPNKLYSFSCETKGKSMVQIKDTKGDILAIGNSSTFKTQGSQVDIIFHCGCENSLDTKTLYTNIQLNEGSQKRYVKNSSSKFSIILPTPLAKVGKYSDLLYQDAKNSWVIEKHTKSLTFEGDELINGKSWELVQEGEITNLFRLQNCASATPNNGVKDYQVNNYAFPKTFDELWSTDEEGSSVNLNGHFDIRLPKEIAPNLEVFKALLKAKPLILTIPIYQPEIIEDVEITLRKIKSFGDEDYSQNNTSSSYRYTGEGNIINIQDTKNGYTDLVYIEGNTIGTLPLDYGFSPYQKFNKSNNTIVNENKVDFRAWEDVETLCYLDPDTIYTIYFKAMEDLICEIPIANEYPVLKKGDIFKKTFNSSDNTEFKIKIWSPKEAKVSISDLMLIQGKVKHLPKTQGVTSVGNGVEQISLISTNDESETLDKQPIFYKNKGKLIPLTELASTPNGVKDVIKKHEDGSYYYHKRVGVQKLTGRMKLEDLATENDCIVVEFATSLKNAQATGKGNTYCDKIIPTSNVIEKNCKGVEITSEGKIRVSIPKKQLKTEDKYGVSRIFNDEASLYYNLEEEEIYECIMFDVKTYIGDTTVTLDCGEISPNKFTCEVRENEGLNVYTFNNETHITFGTRVAPFKVSYIANFKPRLPMEEGHTYIPLATRVQSQLKDLRIFNPDLVDYVNEDKDLATGIYTVVKALRQNGTLKTKSILGEKDVRGNYTLMTIEHYDDLGTTKYYVEKFRLTYDLDGDLISKELIKQW